jgi:hypothetical protein
MRNSRSRFNTTGSRVIAMCVLAAACLPLLAAADDTKKKPAAAPAHVAAPAAKPAGQPAAGANAPHGPASGGGTTASHGPTTAGGAAGVTHPAITTANHGAATHVTTANPGGAKPGAAVNHPNAPGGGGHPGASSHSSFPGHSAPAGSHEMHAANGAAVRTRADGSRSDVHDPKRGMDIHHGLNGNRRISVERADHSRVVAERGGRGYVQHPYMFRGHEFGHRTYFEHGRAYDRFYGRYPYHGGYLDVYAPARYYPYGFYGYAYAPWAAPVPYAWGWGAAPWYGYYGAYYAPYPVYAAPSLWLTDFVFAGSLAAAYAAGHEAGAAGAYRVPEPASRPTLLEASRWVADLLVNPAEAATSAPPALTPEVKQMVADEIAQQVQMEGNEAQANAAKQNFDPGTSNIAHLLSDNHPHVFVAGTDLDLVTGSGEECAISQGDVLRVTSAPAADADTAKATILASKGGKKECASNATVSVAMTDLQDMKNHMQEQIDDGLTELQKKQGKGGLPAAPASASGEPVQAGFAADAPPADAKAGSDIAEQANDANAAEREVSASVAAAPAATPGSSTNIALGQSIDQVTAALGSPTRIIDLGAKKIYTYPDMKVIFQNGKVSDVQ